MRFKLKEILVCLFMFIGSPWLCIAGGLDVGSSISLNLDEPEADTINTYRLKQLIKRDIQGLTKPGWHAHYAHVIVKMVENYEDNGLIVRDYYEWDSLINEALLSFRTSQNETRPHMAYIVNDPEVNIISTEGGLILINVGLLAEIEDYNELRMLLAHELGHVHYHHPFLSYVRNEQQENLATAGTVMLVAAGGLVAGAMFGVGFASGIGFLLNRDETYRKLTGFLADEESRADAHMKKLMSESEYKLEHGLEILPRIDHELQRMAIIHGRAFNLPTFGGAHVNLNDRYEELSSSLINDASNQDAVIRKIQVQTRRDRVRAYSELSQFKQAIVTGWRYLITNENDELIKKEMLDALQNLKSIDGYDYMNGKVLIDGYKVSETVRSEIENSALYTGETYNHIHSFLQIDDLKESPFSVDVSYRDLEQKLLLDLNLIKPIDFEFEKACRLGLPEKSVREDYKKSGETYLDFVEYLDAPNALSYDKYIAVPLNLYLDNSKGKIKSYDEVMTMTDWTIWEKEVDNYLPGFKVVSLNGIKTMDSLAHREFQLLRQMAEITYNLKDTEQDVWTVHPALSNFFVKQRIGHLILVKFEEFNSKSYIELTYVDVRTNRVANIKRVDPVKKKQTEDYVSERLAEYFQQTIETDFAKEVYNTRTN